jgi:ABC-type transport system substrate-binding protein
MPGYPDEFFDGCNWASYDVDTPLPDQNWPWKIPYDPEFAGELLDLAGYPLENGTRFSTKFNKYICETGEICLEAADMIGAAWEALGVQTDMLTEQYGAVVVPRMRERVQIWPVLKNGSVEGGNEPLHVPLPPQDNSMSRPGWGVAFESMFNVALYKKISGERDKATREDWHLDAVDWIFYWQLYSGVNQIPRGIAYDPKAIKSWNARSSQGGPKWHLPEYIIVTDEYLSKS